MSAQPGDAPTARTLFRSPAKPAAGAAAVTPPAAARDLRAEALSTRQAVDLASKSGLRRALGVVPVYVRCLYHVFVFGVYCCGMYTGSHSLIGTARGLGNIVCRAHKILCLGREPYYTRP